jgi:Uma2 family endonuclease
MVTGITESAGPPPETLAELMERLGDVPLERIRLRPPPGTATEEDVLAALDSPRKRLCELVHGVLVEKAMGTREALLAVLIAHFLWNYLEIHDLGIALGADGALRLVPGLVRIPDVCFISWTRLPQGKLPPERIARLAPDLAVEVLSEGNTRKEIQLKIRDYFLAGAQLVWVVYPKTQTAEVYTSPTRRRRVGKNQALEGGPVLPGFRLPLRELFARAERRGGVS